MNEKRNIITEIWKLSHHYGELLYTCENLYQENEGLACINILYLTLEKIIKFSLENESIKLVDAINTLKDTGFINHQECKFLHDIRKKRNMIIHNNDFSLCYEKDRIAYMLDDNDSYLVLYDDISLQTFTILLKIIKKTNKLS